MTQKEKLANEYIKFKKEFDGSDFKDNIDENQVWFLTRVFTVQDLKYKIESVKQAIKEKELRLKREAYFATPEGSKYKKEIEDRIETYWAELKQIHDSFENWIIKKINEMIPGNWTAQLGLGSYMSGNVEIGLVNRDPERNCPMEFGHEFTIYFDGWNFGQKSPRFELNYGTIGAFDLFNNETRPLYLNGLATISNNKEFLQVLMNKFIENCNDTKNISEQIDTLKIKLDNPFNEMNN